MNKYYLYRHIREDKNIPFYIGIGTKFRPETATTEITLYKRAYDRKGRNKIWKDIVSKTKYDVEILFESDNYELIKQKEKEFIDLYGRIDIQTGILANLTDGGEGVSGVVLSVQRKKQISEKLKGRKIPLNILIKRSITTKGRTCHPNVKKANAEKNAISVVQFTKTGEFVKIWRSMSDAERNGFSAPHISGCCKGKRESTGGYKWMYKEEYLCNQENLASMYMGLDERLNF